MIDEYLSNLKSDYYNEKDDELQQDFDQLRIVSQTNIRLRKDNIYQDFEMEEERIRSKFILNLQDLRE